jgi:LPXTG-motif cell wall-anchored protein
MKHIVGRRAAAGLVAAGIIAAPILIAAPANAASTVAAKLPPNCVTVTELIHDCGLTLNVTAFPAHHAILITFSSSKGLFPPGSVLFFTFDGKIYKAVITQGPDGSINGSFVAPADASIGTHTVAVTSSTGSSVTGQVEVAGTTSTGTTGTTTPTGTTKVLGESFTKAATTAADPAGAASTTTASTPTAVEAFNATKATDSSSLPFTGAETGGMVLAGLVLIGGGTGAVVASRRRRAKGTS